MKRAWLLVILSFSARSVLMGQVPVRRDPKTHRVAAAEAPTPSVTPDGRYRFYAEAVSGEGDHLFLRDLTTGETRRLTKGPGETDFNDPIMSPDGRLIAYAWVTPEIGRAHV